MTVREAVVLAPKRRAVVVLPPTLVAPGSAMAVTPEGLEKPSASTVTVAASAAPAHAHATTNASRAVRTAVRPAVKCMFLLPCGRFG